LFNGRDDSGCCGDLLPDIKVDLELGEDKHLPRQDFEKTCQKEGELIPSLHMDLDDLEHVDSDGSLKSLLKLVLVSEDSSEDSLHECYYGFYIFKGKKNDDGEATFDSLPSFAGLLENPVHRKFGSEFRKCSIQQLVGLQSADMKNVWNIKGMMDSANATHSCIICTQAKNTYETNPADWMKDLDPSNANFQKKGAGLLEDAPRREGDYSEVNMWKRFLELHGNEKFNYTLSDEKSRDVTRSSKGVVHEPLLHIHPSKEVMAPLHLSQGLINHFKDKLDKVLQKVDSANYPNLKTWDQTQERVLQLCKRFLAVKNVSKMS